MCGWKSEWPWPPLVPMRAAMDEADIEAAEAAMSDDDDRSP